MSDNTYQRTSFDGYGPAYDIDSATLKKMRRRAAKGVTKLPYEDRRAYADAVEAAVLAKQRQQLKRHGEALPSPRCASGTWHSDGDSIAKAVRAQNRARQQAAALADRTNRTPDEWQAMYEAAMKRTRARRNVIAPEEM